MLQTLAIRTAQYGTNYEHVNDTNLNLIKLQGGLRNTQRAAVLKLAPPILGDGVESASKVTSRVTISVYQKPHDIATYEQHPIKSPEGIM